MRVPHLLIGLVARHVSVCRWGRIATGRSFWTKTKFKSGRADSGILTLVAHVGCKRYLLDTAKREGGGSRQDFGKDPAPTAGFAEPIS